MVYILIHRRHTIVGVFASVDRAKQELPNITDWEYIKGTECWESPSFGVYTIEVHNVKGNLHESCG